MTWIDTQGSAFQKTMCFSGFFSLQDTEASGNWGLFDQHFALEFVKENIKAFRGDPDRITLAGDGSGAVSVGMHLLSEMTRNKPRSKILILELAGE